MHPLAAPRVAVADRPSCVSLYAGAGGLDLGFAFAWAGFEIVWANDADAIAMATHGALFGDCGVPGDIGTVIDKLPAPGSAEVVIGGPPCQGFSLAGRRDPTDPRNRHVWRFMEVVARLRPLAFVMENVADLARSRRWDGLLAGLRRRSADLGYRAEVWRLNAADYGVAQSRERLFLVGLATGRHVRPRPVTAGRWPTVRSVLEALPPWGSPGNDTCPDARITILRRPVLRRSPYAGMLFNGRGRPLDLERPAPTVVATAGGNRTPIVDQETLKTGTEAWVVGYHARLLVGGPVWDGPVPDRLRRLTLEEAAAIQSFPPGIPWAGSVAARWRQVGNAVPPELAWHVALAVRASLGLDGTPPTLAPEPTPMSAPRHGQLVLV
jgi:DNA (cytosine-5)-methyltransferase 1